MNPYYTDLHIHIGRTKSGRAVKITGAKSLTFSNIISHARDEKGLHIIGIIDCHSPEVIIGNGRTDGNWGTSPAR